jgi:hypothetical protein
VSYRYCYRIPRLAIANLHARIGACRLKEEMMADFSKQLTFWKTVLEPVTGNVIKSEADTVTCVVLNEAEKLVLHRQMTVTKDCKTI